MRASVEGAVRAEQTAHRKRSKWEGDGVAEEQPEAHLARIRAAWLQSERWGRRAGRWEGRRRYM